jgi:type I restriction enzyme R subunit
MSKLLADLIKQSRDDTAAYEKFLAQAEALVKRLARKEPDAGVPAMLHGKPEATVLYNNLATIPATSFRYPTAEEEKANLALELDWVVREEAPAGWKGDETREKQLLNALYPKLSRDRKATLAIFEIIKNQPGY